MDPGHDSAIGLALTRLETPDLALDLALDHRTATLSAVFFPPSVNSKTRRLISRELLELYLQYTQGLDPSTTFRKVVQRELFPAVETYLAENIGLRLPRCPAWVITSSTPHPAGSRPRPVPTRPAARGPMTSIVVDEVPSRRRPSCWSCFRTTSKPKRKAPDLCRYRVLRLQSAQRPSLRDQLDMGAIGKAAEAAAGLLMEDVLSQDPYRLADITVPGGAQALSQRLVIAVRARVWVAIPILDRDLIAKPDEIACLAQGEVIALLDFLRYIADRGK